MPLDRGSSESNLSQTRAIIIRLLIGSSVVYVTLAIVLRRPLRALAIESVATIVLWAVYAGRFAFDHPRTIALEVGWFAVQDRLRPPPPEAIVFTGSSTIAHWTTLVQDMRPLPALNRGISGSRLHQIAYWAERLVVAYRPRAVVVYAGESDITGFLWSPRHSPGDVLAAFRGFCESVHARLPRVPISFVSMKPPRRPAWAAPVSAAGNEPPSGVLRERSATAVHRRGAGDAGCRWRPRADISNLTAVDRCAPTALTGRRRDDGSDILGRQPLGRLPALGRGFNRTPSDGRA